VNENEQHWQQLSGLPENFGRLLSKAQPHKGARRTKTFGKVHGTTDHGFTFLSFSFTTL